MSGRRRILGAVLVCAFFPLPWLGSPSARGDDVFAQQRKRYNESIRQFPLLKSKHTIDQIFTMRLDGPDLTLQPHVDPDREYQQHRAMLDGLADPAVILCWLTSPDLGEVQFEFTVDDYSQPGVYGHLHIQSRPNGIEIQKTWQSRTGFERLMFDQTHGSVRMNIAASDSTPNGFTSINVSDTSFLSLRTNHPAEVERWLRPIFREVRQEAVFAADPNAAWQVLADDWPADFKLLPEITRHLSELNDDNFRVRRAGSVALAKLGRDAALVMLKMNRRGLSPEQNLRLDATIGRYQPLSVPETARLHNNPQFLLDCLYCEDPMARKLALARLRKVVDEPITFDPNAPEDQRAAAITELRDQLFPTQATRLRRKSDSKAGTAR